jgi:adenosylmethionine---8-amino-7-oxononanoate aminotransferase
MSLADRSKQVLWPPFTQMKTADAPLAIVRAKDTLLFDENGKSYIDCNSSWWVNVHGHGHPHIQSAIHAQFTELDHVLLGGVTHPKVVELSERVLKILPAHFSKVFFSDDGSTAVEVALKMALQYWFNKNQIKRRIIAMEGAYHGDTFGAMSVGQRGYFFEPFEPFFFDTDFIPFPTTENEAECLEKAEAILKSGDVAALILEPLVQGSAGMRMYSSDFLDRLCALSRKHEALIIFDEVMTGWGRTGKLFAMDHCAIKPDIVCLSKGLTGGVLPMGLTVATDAIYEAFLHEDTTKALLHGHSYTGNPLACAAACASLDIFDQQETIEKIGFITKNHTSFIEKNAQNPHLQDIRQCGTILAIELAGEGGYFSNLKQKAMRYFLEHGMLLRPLGNVIFLNPPYCITPEELRYCYARIEEGIEGGF